MNDDGRFMPHLIYGPAPRHDSYFVPVTDLLSALDLPDRWPHYFGDQRGRLLAAGSFTSVRGTEDGGVEIYRSDFGGDGPFRFSSEELRQMRESVLTVQ